MYTVKWFSPFVNTSIISYINLFFFCWEYLNSTLSVVVVQAWSLSDSFATPWTIVHQTPLSMGFPRQGYWSRFPFPFPGHLPNPWTSCIGRQVLYHWATREAVYFQHISILQYSVINHGHHVIHYILRPYSSDSWKFVPFYQPLPISLPPPPAPGNHFLTLCFYEFDGLGFFLF